MWVSKKKNADRIAQLEQLRTNTQNVLQEKLATKQLVRQQLSEIKSLQEKIKLSQAANEVLVQDNQRYSKTLQGMAVLLAEVQQRNFKAFDEASERKLVRK